MANHLSDSILHAPMKTEEIFRMILECEKKGNIRSLSTKISLELFSFQVVRERFSKNEGFEMYDSSTDSTILYFDDINQEEELVYSITIHHQYKQVVRLRIALFFFHRLFCRYYSPNPSMKLKIMY
jgi:hypothetical protein